MFIWIKYNKIKHLWRFTSRGKHGLTKAINVRCSTPKQILFYIFTPHFPLIFPPKLSSWASEHDVRPRQSAQTRFVIDKEDWINSAHPLNVSASHVCQCSVELQLLDILFSNKSSDLIDNNFVSTNLVNVAGMNAQSVHAECAWVCMRSVHASNVRTVQWIQFTNEFYFLHFSWYLIN